MNEKMIKIAADVLKLSPEEVTEHSKDLPELDACYFWKPTRGGLAVVVNAEGEKLAVGSAIDFKSHVELFSEGKRN